MQLQLSNSEPVKTVYRIESHTPARRHDSFNPGLNPVATHDTVQTQQLAADQGADG